MPNFRLSLNDNLSSSVPSNQEVIYTLNTGAVRQWWVQAVNPNPMTNTSVPTVQCGTDLINVQNVRSRTLRVHYPTAPITVDHQIRSVQPG